MPNYWLLIAWTGLLTVNALLFMHLARIYGWRKVLWGYLTAVYTFAAPLIASAYTLKLIWMYIPAWSRFPLLIILWIIYGVICIYIYELAERVKQKRSRRSDLCSRSM